MKTKNFIIAASYLFSSFGHQPVMAQMMSREMFIAQRNQCEVFMHESHWDMAKKILTRLVATPYAGESEYTHLAFCYLYTLPGRADYEIVQVYARKALAINPESGHAWCALTDSAIELNDYDGCIKYATRALTAKSPDLFAHYFRGRAYTAQHKYAEALKDLEAWDAVIGKTDKSQMTGIMQGEILEKLGKTDEAVKRYKAVEPYHPEDSIKSTVRCLRNAKRFPEAIATASKLIARNSDDSDAYNLRATIRMQTSDWKGAVDDFSHAIELSPTATYYKNRAKAYESMGMPTLAKKDLIEANKVEF